ncbi:MAG: radical SAM protein [Pseudomonadota bacterium]
MMDKKEFITRRYPIFKSQILPRLVLLFYGVPKKSFGSVDVTNKCNLRCKHCYYYAGKQDEEIEPSHLIDKISTHLSNFKNCWSCTWVGGEPLLRQDVPYKLKSKFKFNLIVTNGTLPLPDWKDVSYYISLDGTQETHDKIRGKGVYARLHKNVTDPKNYGKTIRLACCLNNLNKECIEPMLEEWYDCSNVKEMIFDFYTPFVDAEDDLWIPFEERDKIIDKILTLKREKYGQFISGSETLYSLMKSGNRHKAVGSNCIFMKKGFAINASGELKSKCMLGGKADCDRCGCVVPFHLRSISRKYILKDLLF